MCDNVGDHLIGNVYARYRYEADAQRAVDALNDRWYDAKPLFAELSRSRTFRSLLSAKMRRTSATEAGSATSCISDMRVDRYARS